MPPGNLEIVQEMYKRREAGDMYIGEYIHPDIEFARFGDEAPDFTGEWRGIEGLRRATAEYLNVWEEYRFEVERMVDLGDRILVLETQTARGKRSGATISQEVGAILTLRDGKIVRWEYYWNRADALEAADQ
jgi:ketosteroid isomerase-like protein